LLRIASAYTASGNGVSYESEDVNAHAVGSNAQTTMVMKLASPTRAQAISTSVDRNTLNDGAFERGSRSA
jgi:hypothetical protein